MSTEIINSAETVARQATVSDQKLLKDSDFAETIGGVRHGLEAMKTGRT
jgi:hypothetical protein